jgi:hypothetical protein
MSPAPHPAHGTDPGGACDKVIIQTYESDIGTMSLHLTATIVTSMAELRARAAGCCPAA